MNEVFLLSLVAPIVGVIVALDVSGYELSVLAERREAAWRRSVRHAFWHGLFLCIGIGMFEGLGALLHVSLGSLLPWLKEWAISIDLMWLAALTDTLSGAPRVIMTLLGIGLFGLLYWSKLSGAASGEDEDGELPRIFWWARKLPKEHVAAIAVSLDMWYLTPLLRSLIEGNIFSVKAGFAAIVFATVAVVCFLVVTTGRRFLKQKMSVNALAFVLTALVFLEPLGAGYFAARTGIYMLAGPYEVPVGFMLISLAFVAILTRFAGFDKICDNKREEAEEVIPASA